ncbi:MAG: hypothetical protein LASZOEIN_000822 [Candidatus Fervidibacter sp.]
MDKNLGWILLLLVFSSCLMAQPVNLPHVAALMNLSEQAKQRLLRDGILVVTDWRETNLWKAYDDLKRFHNVPVFVTTDACLYQFYELHKAAIKEAETEGFSPILSQILKDWASKAYSQLGKTKWQQESKNAAIVLAVAGKLLDENFSVPTSLQNEVASIVSEIIAAKRVIEGYPFGEDFTQYKPRGHYDASEKGRRYFRTYKWLARRVYDVGKGEELRTAVLMLLLLEELPNGFERYRKFVEAILSLSGEPVGMTLVDLRKAIDAVGLTSLQVLEDSEAIRQLQEELKKPAYGRARIVTHPVPAIVAPPPQLMPEKQIRILPEVQFPDAEVLQWTGDPQVPDRIPSGLDVAAALGSERALELLKQMPSGNLVLERIKPFCEMWAQWSEKEWQGSVYNLWLWAIKALFEVDERTPSFMKTAVWQDWKLNSALASWAQLRHAYGLYGAPVYLYAGLEEGIPPAYLEPNPKCYERLAIATERLQKVLREANVLSKRMEKHLQQFAKLMRQFVSIAEKERRGEPLSKNEAAMLSAFADVISPLPRETPVTVMDIVTHSQTGEVLHVASGKLHPVLVIVDAKPYPPFIAVGWSLSYYEFTRPNFERLTDADWEKWLEKEVDFPEPPKWAYSFRWSAHEELDGFADLRHAEGLMSVKPKEAVQLLRDIAQKYEGIWVGAKARLLLVRHLAENEKFEEAVKELEAFYRSANMQLLTEADGFCGWIVWQWEMYSYFQRAQPYLQHLLKLTEPHQKPLPIQKELLRQDLRAQALLLQIRLLPHKRHEQIQEKVVEIVAQVLRECPKSRFIPAAKAISWLYRAMPFTHGYSPTEDQRLQLLDEALKIIAEHPSSASAWMVANRASEFAFRNLRDAKRFFAAVSKLRRCPEDSEERELLELFDPSLFADTSLITDFSALVRLHLEEGDFEGAWEVMQKAKSRDERLLRVLEAWKREGKEVASLLWRIEQARLGEDFDDLIQTYQSFIQKFPKSRWAPVVLAEAIKICYEIGEDKKAAELEERLLKQFPLSKEALSLRAKRLREEQEKREQMRLAENFLRNLLKGTGIDPNPYLSVAQTDLLSSLDKLLADHPELKEKVVRQSLDEVKGKQQTEAGIRVKEIIHQWLTEHFCERYPDDPLVYEVIWQLKMPERSYISIVHLPLLAFFLSAPEGSPYREEAEKLLEQVLAEKPQRADRRDPFLKLLEYAEQFPKLKPRLFLAAGEWAMQERDWVTARKLLTYAAEEGDEKVKQRAKEAMARLEQLSQPSQKFAKQLWVKDLWQPLLPPPQKPEDCLKALKQFASATYLMDLMKRADTDGKWLVIKAWNGLTCIELLTGKVVWQKTSITVSDFHVIDGVVVLEIPFWKPPTGSGLSVTALDASSGKTLWQREFTGERLVLGKQQNSLILAYWDMKGDKGKLVSINPRNGQRVTEKPLTWKEFLKWQEELQRDYNRGFSDKAFMTDEQGRLIAMWLCKYWLRSPDGTYTLVLLPDGRLSAYSASPR